MLKTRVGSFFPVPTCEPVARPNLPLSAKPAAPWVLFSWQDSVRRTLPKTMEFVFKPSVSVAAKRDSELYPFGKRLFLISVRTLPDECTSIRPGSHFGRPFALSAFAPVVARVFS
jgi:hypothetical protein